MKVRLVSAEFQSLTGRLKTGELSVNDTAYNEVSIPHR